MSFRNLLKIAEQKIGTRRAAGLYYSLVYRFASRLGVSSFNFGYAEIDDQESPASREGERFQLELYRQTALAAGEGRIAGACVLEVSCGLGGGLAHIVRTFGPRLAIGV